MRFSDPYYDRNTFYDHENCILIIPYERYDHTEPIGIRSCPSLTVELCLRSRGTCTSAFFIVATKNIGIEWQRGYI